VIFAGPPGTGKTTLARVIANTTKSRFVTLNAVLDGVAAVRAAVEEASKNGTCTAAAPSCSWMKSTLEQGQQGRPSALGGELPPRAHRGHHGKPLLRGESGAGIPSRVFQLTALSKADLAEAVRRALGDAERDTGAGR
jgi:putative ATPase